MKFFVSGKVGVEEKAKEAMQKLLRAGHEITFDWTTLGRLKPYRLNSSASREAAIKESRGILDAEVLVIIAHIQGVGMYVELGIAIGAGIPVRIVTSTESRSVFFHHPLVKLVDSLEDVLEEFS